MTFHTLTGWMDDRNGVSLLVVCLQQKMIFAVCFKHFCEQFTQDQVIFFRDKRYKEAKRKTKHSGQKEQLDPGPTFWEIALRMFPLNCLGNHLFSPFTTKKTKQQQKIKKSEAAISIFFKFQNESSDGGRKDSVDFFGHKRGFLSCRRRFLSAFSLVGLSSTLKLKIFTDQTND